MFLNLAVIKQQLLGLPWSRSENYIMLIGSQSPKKHLHLVLRERKAAPQQAIQVIFATSDGL